MEFAALYQPIFLLITFIFTMKVIQQYRQSYLEDQQRIGIKQRRQALYLTLFFVLFIGFRPYSSTYFVDMYNIKFVYDGLNNASYIYPRIDNFIYDPLLAFFAISGIPIELFYLFIATIYFYCIYVAVKKIFPRDTMLALLVYLGALSTFSYGTNGIKAGSAASLFLVAIAYKDKLKIALPFLFMSLGFHHSMALPIAAFVLAYFIKKPKWYLYGWLACLLIAALHITFFMNFFAGQTDEHGAEYLNADVEDKVAMVSGFRPDFILYSAVPIFLGYYIVKRYELKSPYYDFIWSVYTIVNSVFLLCTYGSFINRIAYLSWLLYPIVLLYPFVNIVWSRRQSIYLKKTVLWHFGFSVFMFFVYLIRFL